MMSPELACAAVDFEDGMSLAEMVAPHCLEQVFTPLEARCSAAGRGLEGFAGRLAAKRAVAELLPPDSVAELAMIEVLPETMRAKHPCPCRLGHRPVVTLAGGLALALPGPQPTLAVSISHIRTMAVAVAMLSHGGRG